MRVTSNTYTNLVQNASQDAQQRLAVLQQQISTGDSVQAPSDDPLAYEQASQTQANISQLNAYSSAAATATTMASANNSAMTNLHQILANASELATTVTSTMSASDIKNVGAQMSDLVSQLTSIVNQQSGGVYLFGGTADQPPINATTGTYNTAANGQTTSIEVQQGNQVQTSIAAGHAGPPAVDGFLYDSASGVDVLASLKQAVTDLNAGNASAVQTTDLPALNNSLSHISMYVGSTAANMSAVQTASQMVASQITSQSNHLNTLTQTNLPIASVQLSQIQNQYQAALESGVKLMNLSIMNYLAAG